MLLAMITFPIVIYIGYRTMDGLDRFLEGVHRGK